MNDGQVAISEVFWASAALDNEEIIMNSYSRYVSPNRN